MGRRLDLQSALEALLGTDKVYFQPPSNLALEYPCIIYKRDPADTRFADNIPYKVTERYMITVVDRDPDSDIPAKVASLPTSRHNRSFAKNQLNHDVYLLYF